MANILIVDDEASIRETLGPALQRRGHEVVTAASFREGEQFAQAGFDVILLDIMLPDGNGVELLRTILGRDREQSVVMISGHADVETAVEAIRLGAYDFIEKPISLDRVLITIDNATRAASLKGEKDRLASLVYGDFIGEAEAIRQLMTDIKKSAPMATRFLVLGENGTGKELIAHMIHRCSRFAEGPFVAVNCAALPSELIESQLFGHTAGAFTGAGKATKGFFVEADKGSIFLDEISEMPAAAQAKILRVIETRTVTPVGATKAITVEGSIIAASNRDLEKMVAEGHFRQDLLYRLNVVEFKLPPLRERMDDLSLLLEHFLDRFAAETKTSARRLTESALSYLRRFDFPGNARELKNLAERINIYCETQRVSLDDLRNLLPPPPSDQPLTLKDAVSDCERSHIASAIRRHDGNFSRAARELGLERSHLYKKVKKLGLDL